MHEFFCDLTNDGVFLKKRVLFPPKIIELINGSFIPKKIKNYRTIVPSLAFKNLESKSDSGGFPFRSFGLRSEIY